MAEINHSLDWAAVSIELENAAKKMKKYSPEMLRIATNIHGMVVELSKEEINCRRQGRQTQKHQELLVKINGEIQNFERLITFGVLLNS